MAKNTLIIGARTIQAGRKMSNGITYNRHYFEERLDCIGAGHADGSGVIITTGNMLIHSYFPDSGFSDCGFPYSLMETGRAEGNASGYGFYGDWGNGSGIANCGNSYCSNF